MNTTVNTLRITALLLLQILCSSLANADERSPALSAEEFAKQDAIYRSRGEDRPSGYVITRSLLSFSVTLPSDFARALAQLEEGDRWLDIGAGEGRAVLDYCSGTYDGTYYKGETKSGKKALAVAMSIEDRRTDQWHRTAASLGDNQIRYLSGRTLSQYSGDELGKFRVITDVLGGFSYTDDLTRFTASALALLEVNGSLYTVLQDVRPEKSDTKPHYEGSPFLTEIVDADGSELRMCSWLKRIGCVQVSCEYKPDFTPPIEVYRIEKVCNDVTVPQLTPVHYQAGTPPERRFVVKGTPNRQANSVP